MSKSPDAFRTISEVADWLETPAHVLRFWESKFTQVKPVKRAGGRRYYRPADMELLGGIKKLLHHDGQTIKEVQQLLREKGIKHVASLSQPIEDSETIEAAPAEFIEAPSPEEPVFASIAPRKVEVAQAVPEDDADDENQMEFPEFSFTSERAQTEAPAPKVAEAEPEVAEPDMPQGIDISHIPALDLSNIQPAGLGLLGKLAQIAPASLTADSVELDVARQALAAVAAPANS